MPTVSTDAEILQNIAANMTRILKDTGKSQGDVARAIREEGEVLQAARMRVSRYSRGKVMPGAGALSRIAEALGVTADALMAAPPKRRTRRAG